MSLVYERVLHERTSEVWTGRCRAQIADVLAALEAIRAGHATPFVHGETPGHADAALACALRFLREAHPDLFEAESWPALAGHAERCEALPAFAAYVQAFSGPSHEEPAGAGPT